MGVYEARKYPANQRGPSVTPFSEATWGYLLPNMWDFLRENKSGGTADGSSGLKVTQGGWQTLVVPG